MDVTSFSDNNFKPKDWINKAWSVSNSEDKELLVSNTVAKLQLHIKQLSNGLDDTTMQMSRDSAVALQQVMLLSRRGGELQERLLHLERRARDVEADTGHSIDSLRRIDKLKSSLQAACESLREADNWARLAEGLRQSLESRVPTSGEPLEVLTQQVGAAAASLQSLCGASDYESKRLQLEVLFNRLEAALSPAIVDALTREDAERALAYGEILRAMGRGPAYVRYWRGVEASRMHESRRASPCSEPAAAIPPPAPQIEWLTNVIKTPTPITELIRLYIEVLPGLEPSPSKLAVTTIRQCATAEDALNKMIDMRRTMTAFMNNIKAMIHNSKEPVEASEVRELGRAVFAPLTQLVPQYTELQTAAFTDKLRAIDTRQEDGLEAARALQLCAEKLPAWSRAAEATARDVAGAACYPHLLPAVEALVAELCSRLRARHRLLGDAVARGDAWRALAAGIATAGAAGALLLAVSEAAAHLRERMRLTQCEPESIELCSYLLGEAEATVLEQLDVAGALCGAVEDAQRVCRTVRELVGQCACEPCATQLEKLSELNVWTDNDPLAADLPDFSIAPQEYITQVGQYLMTLPQHLEPLVTQRGPALAAALGGEEHLEPAALLLREVCNQTCELYLEKLRAIGKMDALGAKRCATDIGYLTSVVEELGGNVPEALRNLERNLRARNST